MTHKATLKAIRDAGCSVSYLPECREYRVTLPGRPETAYFTDDRADAVATAEHMVRHAANPYPVGF